MRARGAIEYIQSNYMNQSYQYSNSGGEMSGPGGTFTEKEGYKKYLEKLHLIQDPPS